MTDGSGAYHMKYNVYNADRLGEESRRAAFFYHRKYRVVLPCETLISYD